jgi:hypothetical protein
MILLVSWSLPLSSKYKAFCWCQNESANCDDVFFSSNLSTVAAPKAPKRSKTANATATFLMRRAPNARCSAQLEKKSLKQMAFAARNANTDNSRTEPGTQCATAAFLKCSRTAKAKFTVSHAQQAHALIVSVLQNATFAHTQWSRRQPFWTTVTLAPSWDVDTLHKQDTGQSRHKEVWHPEVLLSFGH